MRRRGNRCLLMFIVLLLLTHVTRIIAQLSHCISWINGQSAESGRRAYYYCKIIITVFVKFLRKNIHRQRYHYTRFVLIKSVKHRRGNVIYIYNTSNIAVSSALNCL